MKLTSYKTIWGLDWEIKNKFAKLVVSYFNNLGCMAEPKF